MFERLKNGMLHGLRSLTFRCYVYVLEDTIERTLGGTTLYPQAVFKCSGVLLDGCQPWGGGLMDHLVHLPVVHLRGIKS